MNSRLPAQLQFISGLLVAENELRRKAPEISAWDIGEHLDHMLKVGLAILKTIEKSQALEGRGINSLGRLLLCFRWLPRGRAKSPERLMAEKSERDDLLAMLAEIATLAEKILSDENLGSHGFVMKHPVFGNLSRKQALRFLETHNKHHFKIIHAIHQATRN